MGPFLVGVLKEVEKLSENNLRSENVNIHMKG